MFFLVVQSRKHPKRFVSPKGGIEKGEASSTAAQRESWEEGGVRGPVAESSFAPPLLSPRSHDGAPDVPRARYTVHLLRVDELAPSWPEDHERTRRWLRRDELYETCSWREEIAMCWPHLPPDADLAAAIAALPARES